MHQPVRDDIIVKVAFDLLHGAHCIKDCIEICSSHSHLHRVCQILQAAASSPVDRAVVVIRYRDRAMAGGSKRVAAAAVLVLVVMAMVAEYSSVEAAGVCNPNALYACMSAVQGTRPSAPSQQCCNVVRSVDKNCMCNQLKSTSFPAQMVNNGLQLPKKCGRTDLRGFKCGRYTFPY